MEKIQAYLASKMIDKDKLLKGAWDRIIYTAKQNLKINNLSDVKGALKAPGIKKYLFEIMKSAIFYGRNEIIKDIIWAGYNINEEPNMAVRNKETLIHESDIDYVITPQLIYAACRGQMYFKRNNV